MKRGESSQHGTCVGWLVEGRSTFTEPQEINGQVFDERWRPLNFYQSPIGVPSAASWEARWLEPLGLYGYAAAQALRWWIHAAHPSAYCFETRLVRCRVKYSVESVREDEHAVIGGEDRSALMPDWGAQTATQPSTKGTP